MDDFAAIDFETANRERGSVCSVGVVIVRGGQVVDSYYSLIRPRPNYYDWWNTGIHGLDFATTRLERPFPEVWAEVEAKVGGLPFVAHNAAFDRGCLMAAFAAYGMDYPGYEFHCTCIAARRHYGKQLPDHCLGTVAAACGFDLENHHNALADAEACAHIAIEIL